MHEVPRLRTKVGQGKRAICRPSKRPVPESPPEPLQCEHCLGNFGRAEIVDMTILMFLNFRKKIEFSNLGPENLISYQ